MIDNPTVEREKEVFPDKENVTCGPSGIWSQWVNVTPEIASIWLGCMTKNRNVSDGSKSKMTWDMVNGKWHTTHQGIAFDKDGMLCDGQHRLLSIVQSRQPQWMLVTYGLTKEAMGTIDRGKIRSLANSLQIIGHAFGTDRAAAIARRVCIGPKYSASKGVLSDQALFIFMDLHFDAIKFAIDEGDKSEMPSSIAGCIARAYYHVPHEKLVRFCRIVCRRLPENDMPQSGDQSAISLRELRISMGGFGGLKSSVLLYRATQESLRSYLNGVGKKKLRGDIEKDLYPLPDKG